VTGTVRTDGSPQVVVALLTPFDDDGRLDVGALRDHVEFLVEAGVDGLMPCGTTGEGPLLDPAEVEQAIATTVAAAADRVEVIAHIGRPDTRNTIALARRALATGAEAVSAVVPYYYPLTDEQTATHFLALLAAAEGRPVYAYTIPARTGNDLSPDVIRRLVGAGLAGVKDSSKSFERHLEYLQCGCDVLIGTDAMVRAAFDAGAAGCVSALANVRPDLLCALRDGRLEATQDEVLALRAELPFGRLKQAVAERVPGYRADYRAPLGHRSEGVDLGA
jgi:4-hydroxy-tetrahydrodipicolinate synthase